MMEIEVERKTIVASFGFDIDFVLRRISEGEYDRIVLISLYTSEEANRRVEKAYSIIRVFCASRDIECELEKILPERMVENLYSTLFRETSKTHKLELYLTGGPRILVAALLLASLSLPEYLLDRIKLVVEGEGFEWVFETSPGILIKRIKLDETSKNILIQVDMKPQYLGDLARALEYPRSTIHKKLRGLLDLGLITSDHGLYRSIPPFKIYSRK